ncbi:MAG TPA: type IV secretion system DNA-binding domain-containing protein [archaeon]|nr:type IV secretion system DNA-binding domain-containing protein [archaeon]
MFVVTRELYHTEMAAAVYEDLRNFLLGMEQNHCQRIEFLPVEVMRMTCQKLRDDDDLKTKDVEAYVLAEKAQDAHEIESGALIEKRNRAKFGVLVAFIPQGLRLPAEDSYDIQTFKAYDLTGVLKAHIRRMIDDFPEEQRDILRTILSQPSVKRCSVDSLLKYLLAVKNDGCEWYEAGAYLFHINLIPDLGLVEKGVETRIDRNAHCVSELSNADRSVLIAIENLVNEYGLDPDQNGLRANLVSFLRDRNVVNSDAWLQEILEDEGWRSKLTFDRWKFKDITKPGEVEVHLDPLRDPKTGDVAKGLKLEGPNLVATTDPRSPIHLKWITYPKRPENLGHYLIMVVKDTADDEAGEELTRRTVKAGRQSLKLSLKNVELEQGEMCAARVVIHAKDNAGVILDTDESESFYIEGGLVTEEVIKKVNRVRNRAEAVFQSALKFRKTVEVDSEGWEGERLRSYRIKLKTREVYRVVMNAMLYDIQHKNITDPLTCGAWKADMRSRGVLEVQDLSPVEIAPTGIKTFQNFTDARRNLFNLFFWKDEAGVVEVFDLREFKTEILEYVGAYQAMFDEIRTRLENVTSDGQINNLLNAAHSLSRIDTVHLTVGSADEKEEVVLLAPTHPLRMLWVLQYQKLLFSWAEKLNDVSEDEAARLVNPESVDKITSLNIPSAIAFGQNEIYINSDNVDLYWSVLPKGTTTDIRKVVSLVFRLLGQKGGGEITSITPIQLADKVWRYLKHHPYVSTLRLNVINPGDGQLILNTIREIQKSGQFDDLNYDIAFFGDLRYEVMGSAFDEMMEEIVLSEGSQPDVDEALLRPNKNPLFPKLTFSKKRVKESEWKDTELPEAHITVLIDRFSTKVLMRPSENAQGSFCLHNLIAEYRADFDIKGESATWSRKVIPNQNHEIQTDDTCAAGIYKADDSLLRTSACFFDWGKSVEKVPAIQLELSDTDKQIISKIHETSDWVITIDRNFGIEYFDNPRSAPGVTVRSYLIDYTPEFLEGVGHRLIVSTFWLSEIEGLIHDGLRKMGIPGTGFHAAQILDVLKSISGKLALKLINNPNDAREIIGLALTRLLLERDGALQEGVLIPVDSHTDLFAEHKRQLKDVDIRIHRSDLILAHARSGRLCLQLIEVKFRSGAGRPAEEVALKEEIVIKNIDTQKVLETRFVPHPESDRLDREIQNKQLANLLQFYLNRCKRHGLIAVQLADNVDIQGVIKAVTEGSFEVEFERAGFIYNLQGVSKEPENYKYNRIHVIGRDTIRELLDIPADVEAPPVVDILPPEAPPTPPTGSESYVSAEDQYKPTAKEYMDAEKKEVIPSKVPEGEEETTAEPKVPTVKPAERAEPVTAPLKTVLRIPIGLNYDTKKEVFWDPFTATPKKLANQHVLIVGKSGAGKTQSAAAFMAELWNAKVPSVIFDFQGEYMDAKLVNANDETFLKCTKAEVLDAADGIDVNPLEVPDDPHTGNKQNFMKVVYQVATSLAKIFGLGDIQRAILRDAIGKAFVVNSFVAGNKATWSNEPPTLSQVWEILTYLERSEGGNVRNLNLRIQPLFETGVFIESGGARSFDRIFTRTSIIRLSNLATPELMVAVSRFVLQKIYANMLSKGPCDQLRVFAVVDEAHKLSYDETLTELIREARKYGVGILLASQSVKDFDRIVFDMVGTKIALQLEGDDAKVMAENLGLTDKNDRDMARTLILHQPPHRALIRSNHFEPYIQADVTPFWKKE